MRTLRALLTIFLMTPLLAQTPNLPDLQRMIARFAPVELRVDTAKLAPQDRQALTKRLTSARIVDDMFMTQYWSADHSLHQNLAKDNTPLGKARQRYFWINKVPWSSLDEQRRFLSGVSA